ncbi:MAG: rubredoxin [Eubacteriales bacterium]|nr:rubredoxin [Eubacteriales bacterium]
MRRFICSICGYIYDEAKGVSEAGIAPGTKWEELPENWTCPLCGAAKSEFVEEKATAPEKKAQPVKQATEEHKELNALEVSALCSNLAKGCEKQYQATEAALFTQLADFYKAASAPATDADHSELLSLVEQDLDERFPAANAASVEDRGARRALVWSEKVTRILKSLLTRYEKEGEAMIENTGVYVCTICGFIYVGDTPPALCPVCKVPSWKFEKIEGRAM